MKKNLLNIRESVPKHSFRISVILFCLALMALTHNPVMAHDNSATVNVDKVISGKIVSDSGVPLSGVTVAEKNTGNATTTKEERAFTISVPATSVLVISYVGY